MPDRPFNRNAQHDPDGSATSPLRATPPAPPQAQPRWARVAAGAGWTPPEVLYLVEHAAALEAVQALVETLASVLPFDEWLLVAHAANMITDDVAADCPCHPAAWLDLSASQDGLW